ncbi:MAG: pyridine nucleotide-disulfide oxidoreductase [Rhodobacterales bacterium]|nr:MAG: pyridine nucleotide-disulfide oxidoreductase [Rhodobacterales bacterium]
MTHIIAIGAGQAGASLTAKLRSLGYEGRITLIGQESVPPYQRPPLSKAYLLGDMERSRLFLRPEQFYESQQIELRLNSTVTAIDPAAKTVWLGDEALPYDKLALTTGSTPHHLPAHIGGDLQGVYVVRSLADIDSMKGEFQAGRNVLIVGGGYIGLEAAAVAAKQGLNVTLVEMADRILQRVAAPQTSDYFRDLHRRHGVNIFEGVGLEQLSGDERVRSARLSNGQDIAVDFVITGIGIAPATALAQAAGLAIEDGIKTDAQGQTSDAHIWAAGDCASFPHQGKRIRLESVPNAIDQAELVAENMLGAGKDYVAKPWFWSDQYDVKLQIAGLNTDYDRVVVRPGDAANARSHWYYAGDQLLAVDSMNDPRAYMIGKRLIEAGISPAPEAIAAPDTDLKSLLKP